MFLFQKKLICCALAATCLWFFFVSTGYCQEREAVQGQALFPATISGTAFIDANQNGVRDDGEQGLEGIEIKLKRLWFFFFPVEVGTAQTDAGGKYDFSDLRRGVYVVEATGADNAHCTTANPSRAFLVFVQEREIDFGFDNEPAITTTTTVAPTTSVSTTTSVSGGGATYTNALTQFGITWTFDRQYETGQFVNGDYWVIGPVTIVSITNTYHTSGYSPVQGQDGSMINPGTDTRQGYDSSLGAYPDNGSYDSSLNVSYPNGQPISAGNPLVLGDNQTIISAVSWLFSYDVDNDTLLWAEPGCPSINGGTHTPRPILRTAAVLTCLAAAPPSGSFRPPYAGSDKTIRFNVSQLCMDQLDNLSTAGISSIPDVADMEADFERVWLDHVHEYLGSYLHPSENIPVANGYGQYMSMKIGDAALLLNLDFSQLTGAPSKATLVIELVQLGIDLAGIADNSGYWPPNGGHNVGRKWPILFSGLMLDDDHMKAVGTWTTMFQEGAMTFYVTQDDVDRTHSAQWNPDLRAGTPLPYETDNITMPEWGIRHATDPYRDNMLWDTVYRDINGTAYAGFVLAAHIMGQKTAWNHAALFDYEDRWWGITGGDQGAQHVDAFTKSMWNTYRANYPPVWAPSP